MLLQRLVEFAGRHDSVPPFHQERQFSWQLNLTTAGELESDDLLPLSEIDARGRPVPARHVVPVAQRSGTRPPPFLAADDAAYVLGWSDGPEQAAQAATRHRAFIELTDKWAGSEAGCDDPVAQAVASFFRSGAVTRVRRPAEAQAKSGVLIAVAGTPAYQAASVATFWSAEVGRRKGAAGGFGLCLACGGTGPLLDTVPGLIPQRFVPGASNSAALVSINEEVFGYGLRRQLGASPLCMTCGDRLTAGLRRALSPEHSSTYEGQSSRLAWWTTQDTDFDAMSLLRQPSEAEVGALFETVHRGRPGAARNIDTTKFCALTVGGNVARIVVRDWLEMPLDQLQSNIATWFDDQQIASTRPNGRTHHGLDRLAQVCGRWIRSRDRGWYAEFGAKGADRPDGVHRDLVRAAMRRAPLPPSLLAHLVHRVRTDGRLDDPRAALLRLILTRHPLTTEKPMPGLDPTNTTPAYVAGRAFAVLEQIQYSASDNGQRNTTYGDRFFAGAISNPRSALVSGQRDAAAWLRKLRRSEKKRGAAIRYEKELDALFDLLAPSGDVPARTTLHEQSLFLLGYHHQRAHHFAASRAARPTPTDDTVAAGDPVEEIA